MTVLVSQFIDKFRLSPTAPSIFILLPLIFEAKINIIEKKRREKANFTLILRRFHFLSLPVYHLNKLCSLKVGVSFDKSHLRFVLERWDVLRTRPRSHLTVSRKPSRRKTRFLSFKSGSYEFGKSDKRRQAIVYL